MNTDDAITIDEAREEAERLGCPGPDVKDHPEDNNGACFCLECLGNG